MDTLMDLIGSGTLQKDLWTKYFDKVDMLDNMLTKSTLPKWCALAKNLAPIREVLEIAASHHILPAHSVWNNREALESLAKHLPSMEVWVGKKFLEWYLRHRNENIKEKMTVKDFTYLLCSFKCTCTYLPRFPFLIFEHMP